MYQVLELNEANTSIPVNYAGKIVHLECYGSEDIKYSVALNKNVSYKRKIEKWFDIVPTPGTTKTSAKSYQLPNDGIILYANGTDQTTSVVNAYRNGHYELKWQLIVPFQDPTIPNSVHRWTLTHFKYVEDVKTTIATYTWDDVGEVEEGSDTRVYTDYPETLTLTASDESTIVLTLIDEEFTVEDTWCSGAEKRIVGFEPVTDTKEIPLIELENADDEAIVDNPTYSSCAIYCNIGDVISIDNTEAEILASKILIYIEI